MKNLKYMSLMLALLCVVSLGFTSCGDDDDDDELPAMPVVTLTEVGHDNSKHAHPGHDLHLEADVVAEGLIKSINIEIHQENGDNSGQQTVAESDIELVEDDGDDEEDEHEHHHE